MQPSKRVKSHHIRRYTEMSSPTPSHPELRIPINSNESIPMIIFCSFSPPGHIHTLRIIFHIHQSIPPLSSSAPSIISKPCIFPIHSQSKCSSSASLSLSPLPTPSFLIGILIPCVAKHLLNSVLSTTPGNLLAEYTVKTSLKHAAKTGALLVLTVVIGIAPLGLAFAEVLDVVGTPTFTNEKWSLYFKIC